MSNNRCGWTTNDPLMIKYHDTEWGVPLYDDDKLFEFIVLDSFQAGLSWKTILYKRENFRIAFDQFNPKKIAKYNEKKITKLLQNQDIIRNKMKIEATIANANTYLKIQKEYGSFSSYIWQFTEGKIIINKFKKLSDIPASSPLSELISKDMKKNGFRFVGSTILYAFMQAIGMVNDHLVTCFRYKEVIENNFSL